MTTPVSVSVEIKAPVEKVWAMITDLPRMGEWSPENKGGEWMKGATTAAVGTSFIRVSLGTFAPYVVQLLIIWKLKK